MTYDYSEIPTPRLAAETMVRARQVSGITDESWDAVGPTFGWFIPFAFSSVSALFFWTEYGLAPPTLLVMIMTALFGVLFWRPYRRWQKAIQACKDFTAEMKARRLELERRNAR